MILASVVLSGNKLIGLLKIQSKENLGTHHVLIKIKSILLVEVLCTTAKDKSENVRMS
jgi:hypothetical protein